MTNTLLMPSFKVTDSALDDAHRRVLHICRAQYRVNALPFELVFQLPQSFGFSNVKNLKIDILSISEHYPEVTVEVDIIGGFSLPYLMTTAFT